jgi:hypothetical protein
VENNDNKSTDRILIKTKNKPLGQVKQ